MRTDGMFTRVNDKKNEVELQTRVKQTLCPQQSPPSSTIVLYLSVKMIKRLLKFIFRCC